MDIDDSFRLDVWKGDWGLSSVDFDCLQILTYAKFCSIPLKINTTSNPFRTPHGQLPVLRHNRETLDNAREILQHFRIHNHNSDFTINSKQCADVAAYESLLKTKLYPALQFIWWIDERNFNELMRPWYSKALPFPFNFYYPGSYEKRTRTLMECLYPTEENIVDIEKIVYTNARECITMLSTKLGDSEFFFGAQPTTLDAIVYSYLAPLLKAPLPNQELQTHLKLCENLVKFISRITQRYFKTEYQEYEKVQSEKNEKRMRKDSDSEFPNKKRNQIFAGLFAALAMVGYALSSGMVEVLATRDELEDLSEDYIYEDTEDGDE